MPVLKAKGEAEALCAELNREGLVDACVTADSDVFLFGATCVIKHIHPNSKDPFECYYMSDIEAGLGLTRNHLIAISILVGNDHNLSGVRGIGLETARRFAKSFSKDEILDRLLEISRGGTVESNDIASAEGGDFVACSSESPRKPKLPHCSFCGHPGSKRAHLKSGCEFCSNTGEDCKQKAPGFTCSCSSCDMDRKENEQRKNENWHIKVCRKIAMEDFPHDLIIKMYLHNDNRHSDDGRKKISWTNPKTDMLVDYLAFHQQWEPSYTRKRMLPMLSTLFLRDVAASNPENLLLYGQYEFDHINRQENMKSNVFEYLTEDPDRMEIHFKKTRRADEVIDLTEEPDGTELNIKKTEIADELIDHTEDHGKAIHTTADDTHTVTFKKPDWTPETSRRGDEENYLTNDELELHDEAGRDEVIIDLTEELDDGPEIHREDGCCYLSTDEDIELVRKAFPEKVNQFLKQKELIEAKSARKRRGVPESSVPSGEIQLRISEFFPSSKPTTSQTKLDGRKSIISSSSSSASKKEQKEQLSNLSKLSTKGAEIIQAIEKELNLRVSSMMPREVELDTKGKECNVSSYLIDFLDMNDMRELWQSAARKAASGVEENGYKKSDALTSHVETSDCEERNQGQNRKRKETEEGMETSEECETKKKPRLNWTPDMHQRFVEAIQKLGYDKAVPKKIVEFMNEPGLTREHVASHLQKYRTNLKKGQESSTDFSYGLNLAKESTKPLYGSSLSTLNCNPSQRHSSPFDGNSSVFSTPSPLLRQSYLLNPNLLASMSTLAVQPHIRHGNSNQGVLSHVLSPKLSSFDAMLHRKQMNREGPMEFQPSFVPKMPLRGNFTVYGDEKRSMLLAVPNRRESSHHSLAINQPNTCDSNFRFLGLRVVNDELQFGDKSSISCTDIQRESSSSLTTDWVSGNADSVSISSGSLNPIPQQQSSLPSLESLVQCEPFPDSFPSFNSGEMSESFISHQQATFPPFYTLYNENSPPGFSAQGISSSTSPEQQLSVQQATDDSENYAEMFLIDDHQSVSLSVPGNSGNFSSTQQESSSLEVPPAVLEINSYGGEEDISALLDATDAEHPESFWDDDFNDLLFSITN
ncbi:unnamed protein product [Cuscuta campestris]|uniref:HTH myb-type domain-containing protein n=1 Tax=Cuscuta campestris TaxID=132261 RepID=A0A484KPG2_9ASTE|nr:unnamed protein product [Cuscuta campestris]